MMEGTDTLCASTSKYHNNSPNLGAQRIASSADTSVGFKNTNHASRRTSVENQPSKRKSRSAAILHATKSKVSKLFVASIGGVGEVFNYEQSATTRSEPGAEGSPTTHIEYGRNNKTKDIFFGHEHPHASTPNLHRDKKLPPAPRCAQGLTSHTNSQVNTFNPVKKSISAPHSDPGLQRMTKSFSRTGSAPNAIPTTKLGHDEKRPQKTSPKLRSALFRHSSIPSTPPTVENVVEVASSLEEEYEYSRPRPRSWSLPSNTIVKSRINRNLSDGSPMYIPRDWCVDGFERCNSNSRSMSIEPKLESCKETYEIEIIEESPVLDELQKKLTTLTISGCTGDNG